MCVCVGGWLCVIRNLAVYLKVTRSACEFCWEQNPKKIGRPHHQFSKPNSSQNALAMQSADRQEEAFLSPPESILKDRNEQLMSDFCQPQ